MVTTVKRKIAIFVFWKSVTCERFLKPNMNISKAAKISTRWISFSLFNHAQTQTRFISIGTDLKTKALSLQSIRPWHMANVEGSNKAADNAKSMGEIFANKKVAVFGVPAPFTGTCTTAHYPPYKQMADQFYASGIDSIICYSVSDPYAHNAWSKALGNDSSKITFLADPDAQFAKALKLDVDYSDFSLGVRSKRFSMVVEDGVVRSFHLVEDASKDAENLLKDVKTLL